MVTFYGLILSLIINPWKCYLMSTDSTIIGFYVGQDMVIVIVMLVSPSSLCVAMTQMLV